MPLVSQVSELNKRLHEAMSTANEAKEEARLQRQGHAEVLAFCRESAQGCNTVTRKCMDDTRQYVAVEVTQPESPRDPTSAAVTRVVCTQIRAKLDAGVATD